MLLMKVEHHRQMGAVSSARELIRGEFGHKPLRRVRFDRLEGGLAHIAQQRDAFACGFEQFGQQ